jgi:hypothetical protein
MSLKAQSMFLYGFQVTNLNNAIDFQNVSMGPILLATLNQGFYSLTALSTEIVRALQAADPLNTYTVTVDRTVAGGTQNRVTISSSAFYFSILFGTGPRATSSCASLIGFAAVDQIGFTSYTGTSSAGTPLTTYLNGYNYIPPTMMHKIQGNVNVSANGTKEAVVFQIQQFWQVEFQHEPEAKVIAQWGPMMDWLIQQRLFEFTPEITSPSVFIEGTLETTTEDGKGLGFNFKEMLPNFPFDYQTGTLKFRVNTQ